jgi:hypothetical protein
VIKERNKMTGTIQERFEAKFTKSDGCWEWEAGKDSKGYGAFRIAGRMQLSHRVAYQLYVGEIPAGLCACHRCDNPGCVNPAHLFLGTQADNVRDRDNKGRCKSKSNWTVLSGEKNGNSKLTEKQVIEILAKHANGARGVDLAKEFGAANQTISNIVCGHTWTKI